MKFLSSIQTAEKWGLSPRRVITLCKEGRIDGAQQAGKTWIIPDDALKPSDARIRSGKYVKDKSLLEKPGKAPCYEQKIDSESEGKRK